MSTRKKSTRPVVVTTAHRGIFVGYTDEAGNTDTITLAKARMVVYYPQETRGVVGIAARGTPQGSRVTEPADRITLRSVTAVMDATEVAAKSWELTPWS